MRLGKLNEVCEVCEVCDVCKMCRPLFANGIDVVHCANRKIKFPK